MKKQFLFLSLFLILSAFIAAPQAYSQSQNTGHLVTMTFLQIPNEQISEFFDFWEKEAKPLDAENEYILSTKIYTHMWGPAWTVCLVTEYKDWEGFIAAEKRGNEIFDKKYTDETKRSEIGKKFSGFLNNHTDAIVYDHPNLQK